MAEDSFDVSLCNYNLSNPPAVFYLARNYKCQIEQVSLTSNLIQETGCFYPLSKKVSRGHGKFSANMNLCIGTVLPKAFFLGFFIPVPWSVQKPCPAL